MEAWQRVESTRVTKVGWRTITTKTFTMPDGAHGEFDTVHRDGQEFVGVIPVTTEQKVVVARQFRPGPEKVMDELPGGFVDVGETPEVAGRRELLEETGYAVGDLEYLGIFHKDAYMNAVWHIFLATNCTKVAEPTPEAHEHIEVDEITIDQLFYNAIHDRMTDHASILMAYESLKKLR